MHPCSQRGLGKLGQCSDIAPDERDWFGRSWEGLLGRPWPKRPWQGLKGSIGRSWPGGKVEGYSHFCPPDHGVAAKFLHAYLVFEDGSSISPWVARVPLPANEADRPSCSSTVVSGVPNRNAVPAESMSP